MVASQQVKVPPDGIWAPAITLLDNDQLTLAAQAQYYTYLATTGLAGLVIMGTNGETFLLTAQERATLIATARAAVGPSFPIMAGCGAHSTAQVLAHISDAAGAGADYALVLPPGYFGKATTPAVVERFYDQVAEKSELPIVIYNFPAVTNGVDLDSDVIARLAQRHRNIVGVKLTCGSVAKVVRLSAALPAERFKTFGGQSDFLLGALASGAAGCIAAFANVAPRTVVRVYELWKEGRTAEALELHRLAALAENPCKAGIATVKFAAARWTGKRAGIEGAEGLARPREPYVEPAEEAKVKVVAALEEVQAVEERLWKEATAAAA
ncbi:Lipase GDSL [Macrophomina phaseolina MS6]|uniref:Lipase GDSL n=2 Tax=Macrophomina phaseolina TaxID=35725 RepID=K2RYZ7_MACPH|nr:Lipase GDSL [Macrophomina phaseolina MS6]KAH7064929.1 dihydrodipicolinate synthetase [Macrophomina phaseolina]